MEFAGEAVATQAFTFEATEGNEEILVEMAESALGFVRRRAQAEARAVASGGSS